MRGVKHLIQCHCVLPQYRKRPEPLFHKFTVFSLIDDEDSVIPKFAQCNNCQAVHKIIDLCKSEIIPCVDESSAILSINDVRASIPEKFCKVLDKHNCDLGTWEQLKFILEQKLWEEVIVLTRETLGDSTQLKILKIDSEGGYTLETHLRQEEILGEYLIE